jgi:hypothetical protein
MRLNTPEEIQKWREERKKYIFMYIFVYWY